MEPVASLSEILKLSLNYGFPSVALILVCYAGWKISNKIMDRSQQHQDQLMTIIQNDLKINNDNTRSIAQVIGDFKQSVGEGMKYQREEHVKIIDVLTKLEARLENHVSK